MVRLGSTARMLIIGQAPGTRVHASGTPWDDASGRRLREWLELEPVAFYDTSRIAVMPMAARVTCHPGANVPHSGMTACWRSCRSED